MKTVKQGPPYRAAEGFLSAEEFAVLFNRALTRRGLTLARVANLTGLSYNTVKNYSNAKSRPCEQAVDLLVNELGIPREELLGDDFVRYAESKVRRQREHKLVTDAFDALTEQERRSILTPTGGIDPSVSLLERLEILAGADEESLRDMLFRLSGYSNEVKAEVAAAGQRILDREEFGEG